MAERANALVLKFRADTANARNAISSLATNGVSQMALLGAAAAAAGKKMDSDLVTKIWGAIRAVTALHLAYTAFAAASAAAVAIAIDRMEDYQKLAKDAASVGVSTDFFQKFTQSAGQAEDKVKMLAVALNKAREATRERTGGNSQAGDLLEKYSSNSGLLKPFVEEFRVADTLEAKIRAITKAVDDLRERGYNRPAFQLLESLFGTAAADEFVARAEKAKKSIAEIYDETTGKEIVSAAQIENAAELERRLEDAQKRMENGLKPIMQDLETLGMAIRSSFVDWKEQLAAVIEVAGKLYSVLRSIAGLVGAPAAFVAQAAQAGAQAAGGRNFDVRDAETALDLRKQLADVEEKIANIRGKSRLPEVADTLARPLESEAANLRNRLTQFERSYVAPPDLPPLARADEAARRAMEKAREERLFNNPPAAPTGPKIGGGGAREEADAYEKLVANIEKATAALQAEYNTLGLNRFERERAVLLAKADAELEEKGRELTAAERADLEAKIDTQARYKMLIEDTKSAMEKSRELQNFIGSNVSGFLSDIISGGKNAEEALMNLTKRLADAAFQALLLGQGPLAGLFGTAAGAGQTGGIIGALFGGFRAGGGDVMSGRPYVVGERRPELFVPRSSGTIIPYVPQAGGRSVTVQVSQSFDMRGADTGPAMRQAIAEAASRAAVETVESRFARNPNFLGGRI